MCSLLDANVAQQCGEEYPSCHNCTNRRVKCVYGGVAASSSGNAAPKTSRVDARSILHEPNDEIHAPLHCPCQQSTTNPAPVWTTRLQELRLMIHYTTKTYETLSHGRTDDNVWREVVPGEAVLHEFLMDGLLALSSLHFASQNPNLRWQYTEIASKYQSAGLQKYKYALERITNDNGGALFVFSIIVSILALAFPNVCPPNVHPAPTHSSHTESITMLLDLLQGISLINSATELSSPQGGFAALFRLHLSSSKELALSDDTVSAFAKLRERTDSLTSAMDIERQRSYALGIESLQEVFRYMNTSRDLARIIAWPVTAGDGLLRLFKQNDLIAQFIFIHYGVLLLHARDRWWGRDTGIHLIEDLSNSLHAVDPEWITWTQWARASAARVIDDC